MSFFSRVFKSKDSSAQSSRSRSQVAQNGPAVLAPPKAQYEDAFVRKQVMAEEVQELLHFCTQEMKSRALDMPFLLLPFRPNSNPAVVKKFIRNFFKARWAANGSSAQSRGPELYHELRLVDPMVLCSILKWCWSRLSGGVVTWETYELFRSGERNSNMGKSAFETFIPLSVESEARKGIIFDFFDLMAAISANAKHNGLGGRKLSRLAGWWAFEHSDKGKGFDGGYKSWADAADASSHLFFAYLRSMAPNEKAGSSISRLPQSLQSLLAQTEYPPETPTMLQSRTSKVVLIVDTVSPTPYALLRRAKHFDYRDNDAALRRFSDYVDPVEALTPECRRVLESISSTNRTDEPSNSATATSGVSATSPTDSSWSRFEDMGFSSVLDGPSTTATVPSLSSPKITTVQARTPARSRNNDFGRPTTPSWADFMSSGFSEGGSNNSAIPPLLAPNQMLPPLSPSRVQSSQSHYRNGQGEDNLEPGELASISYLDLDETFWWVWMTSLASEEPAERKAVFGRCAMVETEIQGGRWLLVEEQVKGASPEQERGAYVIEKKSRNIFTRRGRNRRPSVGKSPFQTESYQNQNATVPQIKKSVGAQHQAAVQAAAVALVQKQRDEENLATNLRRGRSDDDSQLKTASVMTLQPVIMKDAAPAMQWARKYDKEAIRAQYLGTADFGDKGTFKEQGQFRTPSPSGMSAMLLNARNDASQKLSSESTEFQGRKLPAIPPSDANVQTPPRELPPSPRSNQPSPLPTETTESLAQAPGSNAPATPSETPGAARPSYSSPMKESPTPNGGVVAVSENRAHVKRKSLPSVHRTQRSQPDLREVNQKPLPGNSTINTTPPKRNNLAASAAAAAAAKAYQQKTLPMETNIEYVTPLQKSKKGSTRGFKRIFERRRANTPETSGQTFAGDLNANSAQPAQEKIPGRRLSLLRRKQPQPLSRSVTPAAAGSQEPGLTSMDQEEPGTLASTKGLNVVEPPQQSPAVMEEMEAARSKAHPISSRQNISPDFTQGPIEDIPASMPENDSALHQDEFRTPERGQSPISDVSPQPFQTRAAARLLPDSVPGNTPRPDQTEQITPSTVAPRFPGRFQSNSIPEHEPVHSPLEYDQSEVSEIDRDDDLADDEISDNNFGLAPQTATVQDRWAQIRKNALERKASEEQAPRHSASVRTERTERTDDGETSGEETIEQRVARIKERVAQLTSGPGH